MTTTTLHADVVQTIVQNPKRFFVSDRLRNASFRTADGSDRPLCWTGKRAFVYCADFADGSSQAVRFPRSPEPSTGQRYEALARHLADHPGLPLVTTDWQPRGASYADGSMHPIMAMDWVSGLALDVHLDQATRTATAGKHISELAVRWRRLAEALTVARVGHGDIHGGNVLVRDDAEIVLVDYDCVWLPRLKVGTSEQGRPAFRHPAAGTMWGEEMDAFPNTLVYVTLAALAHEPGLWSHHRAADDHLIFTADDLAEPDRSSVFGELLASTDDHVRAMAGSVVGWLGTTPERYRSLEHVIAEPITAPMRTNVWPPRSSDGSPPSGPPSEARSPDRAPRQVWSPRPTEVAPPSPSTWQAPAPTANPTRFWTPKRVAAAILLIMLISMIANALGEG